jgi:CheY-like chemotaxis protein
VVREGHLKGYKIRARATVAARADAAVREGARDPARRARLEPPSRCRILIVDDEEAVVSILEEYLRQMGQFDWQVARNGYEAGLKTRSFRPHLLLTDYNLGDITGGQVAESIRADDELAEMKIVVFSGFVSESEALQLKARGVDEFLRKPFSFEDVRDAIFKLLKIGA